MKWTVGEFQNCSEPFNGFQWWPLTIPMLYIEFTYNNQSQNKRNTMMILTQPGRTREWWPWSSPGCSSSWSRWPVSGGAGEEREVFRVASPPTSHSTASMSPPSSPSSPSSTPPPAPRVIHRDHHQHQHNILNRTYFRYADTADHPCQDTISTRHDVCKSGPSSPAKHSKGQKVLCKHSSEFQRWPRLMLVTEKKLLQHPCTGNLTAAWVQDWSDVAVSLWRLIRDIGTGKARPHSSAGLVGARQRISTDSDFRFFTMFWHDRSLGPSHVILISHPCALILKMPYVE